MSGKRGKDDDDFVFFWLIFVGLPVYLLMSHPVIFWLVFVPLSIYFIVKIVKWLRK